MTWTRVAAYWAGALVLMFVLQATADKRAAVVEEPSEQMPLIEAVVSRVDRFRLSARGIDLDFERGEDGRWTNTSPAGETVSADIVEAVVETLVGLPVIEAVSDTTEHDDQFGLKTPEARLRLDIDGSTIANLAMGAKNPTRTAVYVRRAGEDRVFLVGLNARHYMDLMIDTAARELGLPSAGQAKALEAAAKAEGAALDVVPQDVPQDAPQGAPDVAPKLVLPEAGLLDRNGEPVSAKQPLSGLDAPDKASPAAD